MAVKRSNQKQTSKKEKSYNLTEDKRFVFGLFAVFCIFIFIFSSYKITGDDDFFWHLATGRYIVENKVVPDRDVFGHVTSGVEWIPFEWGWDVLTYTLNGIGGYNLILVLRSFVFSLIFFLLFYLLNKFKVNSIVSFLVLFTLAFAIIDRLSPRPHIFTYLFFVLVLYIYTSFKYLDREKYFKYIYILPVIFLIWSNMHMGVLAGGLLLFVFGVGEVIIYFYPNKFSTNDIKPLSKEQLIRFLIVCFICAITLIINPHGLQTYLYAYEHTKMKMLETVNEWQNPFSSKLNFGFVVTLYKILLLSGAFIVLYAFSKKDLIFGLVYLAFALYSIRAIRFTVDYEIIISFFLAVSLNYFLHQIKSVKNKGTFLNNIFYNNITKAIIAIFLIFIISQIPSNSLYQWMQYYRVYGYGVNKEFLPIDLYEFMKANNITGIPFNHFGTGGSLVWEFPGQKNFIDSRNLNDEIFSEYNNIMTMRPGFENKLDKYNIEYVLYLDPDLIRRPRELNQMIVAFLSKNSDRWKLVFWDDKSFLFLRNIPKYADLISKYEYKVMNPYNLIFNKPLFDNAVIQFPEKAKEEKERKIQTEPNGYLFNSIMQTYPVLSQY